MVAYTLKIRTTGYPIQQGAIPVGVKTRIVPHRNCHHTGGPCVRNSPGKTKLIEHVGLEGGQRTKQTKGRFYNGIRDAGLEAWLEACEA
jgi:hypothetical protein